MVATARLSTLVVKARKNIVVRFIQISYLNFFTNIFPITLPPHLAQLIRSQIYTLA